MQHPWPSSIEQPTATETDTNSAGTQFVIIAGDPVDGIALTGPFASEEAANEHAEDDREIRNDTWWVVGLNHPSSTDEERDL